MAKQFSIEAIFKIRDRLSAPVAKIAGKLSAMGRGAAKAFQSLDGAATKSLKAVGRFGDALGVGAVLSLGALGYEMGNIIEHGRELEKTLIRTGSAFEKPVRVGTEEFAKLTAAARQVGATTEFSAQQGAEGLNSLATAGYSLEQSISALPGIIDFASAATLDLSQASDITSDTLGAFNLRTEDAAQNTQNMARVMDVLTRAAADSTTNVAELFEGIRAGGAFAKTSGATLEQFAALQGTLANKGIKGAEAGTAIRNAYLHLTSQTKQAAEAQKKLGVKTAKNRDGSIDMITTIGRFSKATEKLTRDKKAEAIATIFGAFAVGPFLALLDAGEGSVREFSERLEGATGITQEMAKAMRASTDAKIAMFWNKIENLRLTVFDALAPTLVKVADAVGKWVTENEKLIGSTAAEWAAKLQEKLPEIWDWTVKVTEAVAGLIGVALGIKAVNFAIDAYNTAVKIAEGVAWAWNAAVKAGALIADSSAVAAVRMKIATVASRVATFVATGVQTAYNAVLNLHAVTALRVQAAEIAARIAQVASRVATFIATGIQAAYAAVLATTATATGAFTAATGASVPVIGAANAAFAPLLVTLGAAAAAIGALYLAWDQFNKLDKSLAGSGGVSGTLGKMIDMGTLDVFAAHDAVMNEKAIEARAKADQQQRENDRVRVVPPQERAAQATADAAGEGAAGEVGGTITVEQKPGTKATVKNRPKSPTLVVKPSGAFPS
jgi:TP901 family phage tail tape measure protein